VSKLTTFRDSPSTTRVDTGNVNMPYFLIGAQPPGEEELLAAYNAEVAQGWAVSVAAKCDTTRRATKRVLITNKGVSAGVRPMYQLAFGTEPRKFASFLSDPYRNNLPGWAPMKEKIVASGYTVFAAAGPYPILYANTLAPNITDALVIARHVLGVDLKEVDIQRLPDAVSDYCNAGWTQGQTSFEDGYTVFMCQVSAVTHRIIKFLTPPGFGTVRGISVGAFFTDAVAAAWPGGGWYANLGFPNALNNITPKVLQVSASPLWFEMLKDMCGAAQPNLVDTAEALGYAPASNSLPLYDHDADVFPAYASPIGASYTNPVSTHPAIAIPLKTQVMSVPLHDDGWGLLGTAHVLGLPDMVDTTLVLGTASDLASPVSFPSSLLGFEWSGDTLANIRDDGTFSVGDIAALRTGRFQSIIRPAVSKIPSAVTEVMGSYVAYQQATASGDAASIAEVEGVVLFPADLANQLPEVTFKSAAQKIVGCDDTLLHRALGKSEFTAEAECLYVAGIFPALVAYGRVANQFVTLTEDQIVDAFVAGVRVMNGAGYTNPLEPASSYYTGFDPATASFIGLTAYNGRVPTTLEIKKVLAPSLAITDGDLAVLDDSTFSAMEQFDENAVSGHTIPDLRTVDQGYQRTLAMANIVRSRRPMSQFIVSSLVTAASIRKKLF